MTRLALLLIAVAGYAMARLLRYLALRQRVGSVE